MFKRVNNHQYWAILFAQILLIFISAIMKDHPMMRLVFAGTMVVVLGTVIGAIWRESKLPLTISIVAACLAVTCGALGHLVMGAPVNFSPETGMPIDWMMVTSMASYTIFVAIAIFSIGRHIFLHDRVTSNVVAGGICVYVLIGMGYAFIYSMMSLLGPEIFSVQGMVPSQVFLSDFFYFSYSTLTTAGFGDITARSPLAKAVASIEALTGTLFIAVMIAGLVGTYFLQREHPRKINK